MCVKLRVHFGSILGPFWVHSGSILGPFWVHFGSILGPFWVHFGSILGPFWVHFGVHFGSILGPLGLFWVHFGSILGPFVYCLSGDASFNQHLTKNRYFRQESVFRQECSSDKNSSLDCLKKRASEASKGKRAKRAPLCQQTHLVTHIINAFGDTHVNAFGDTHINAFGDTHATHLVTHI